MMYSKAIVSTFARGRCSQRLGRTMRGLSSSMSSISGIHSNHGNGNWTLLVAAGSSSSVLMVTTMMMVMMMSEKPTTTLAEEAKQDVDVDDSRGKEAMSLFRLFYGTGPCAEKLSSFENCMFAHQKAFVGVKTKEQFETKLQQLKESYKVFEQTCISERNDLQDCAAENKPFYDEHHADIRRKVKKARASLNESTNAGRVYGHGPCSASYWDYEKCILENARNSNSNNMDHLQHECKQVRQQFKSCLFENRNFYLNEFKEAENN